MQLNINTPTSNIAFLGNQAPLSTQQQQARPFLNAAEPQPQELLLGIYLNLLRSSVPPYALNSWSNPTTGFGQNAFTHPANSQQQAFFPTARQYAPPTYPQYRTQMYPQYLSQMKPQYYYPIAQY